jgi:hypothetical protein
LGISSVVPIRIVSAISVQIIGAIYVHSVSSNALNVTTLRPVGVRPIVVTIVVIEVRSASVDVAYPVTRNTIAIHSWTSDVNIRNKNPVVVGDIDIDVNIHSETQRCPSVIAPTRTPAYPSRPPLITGNPYPTVIVVKLPTPVVKWSPSPSVIGHPSIAVFGHFPVSISSIRLKAFINLRPPNLAVGRIIQPLAIRR